MMRSSGILTLIFTVLLAGCTAGNQEPDPAVQAAKLAEEAAQAADAATAIDSSADIKPAASDSSAADSNPAAGQSDNEDLVKVFINASGQLCADILSVRPLDAGNRAEVICKEHVDRPGRVTYEIDLSTERVVRR